MAANIRPTAMIFYEQPTEPWNEYDFKFLEAYQILLSEMCSSCGHPVWLCRSDSNIFKWSVKSTLCNAERALQMKEWRRTREKGKKATREEQLEWGRHHFPVPELISGFEDESLPTRRDWFEAQAAKHTS